MPRVCMRRGCTFKHRYITYIDIVMEICRYIYLYILKSSKSKTTTEMAFVSWSKPFRSLSRSKSTVLLLNLLKCEWQTRIQLALLAELTLSQKNYLQFTIFTAQAWHNEKGGHKAKFKHILYVFQTRKIAVDWIWQILPLTPCACFC